MASQFICFLEKGNSQAKPRGKSSRGSLRYRTTLQSGKSRLRKILRTPRPQSISMPIPGPVKICWAASGIRHPRVYARQIASIGIRTVQILIRAGDVPNPVISSSDTMNAAFWLMCIYFSTNEAESASRSFMMELKLVFNSTCCLSSSVTSTSASEYTTFTRLAKSMFIS